MEMMRGHEETPGEEHEAHQVMMTVPKHRGLVQPQSWGCSTARCNTPQNRTATFLFLAKPHQKQRSCSAPLAPAW